MGRVAFNTSMLTDKPSGVGIYTQHLMKVLKIHLRPADYSIYRIKELRGGVIAVYRLLWNIFALPWRTRKDDLVFSFSTHGSPFIKRQIITVHDLISLNFPEQHKVQYLYFKYIVPWIIKSCVKVVAISEFTKAELIRYYKIPADKVVVIRNGANYRGMVYNEDADQQVFHLTKGKPYFLCVGAAYSHKNIHRLLEAIQLLDKSHLFVIVGKENAYFDTVRNEVQTRQLHNVVLLDYVDDSFLQALYKKAVCNIYVSLYEGFGFPPLEAAALNTVSLVSAIPALIEIYGETVMYTDPYDTVDMAAKINLLIEDRINTEVYKRQFNKLLLTYTWERAATETMELINNNFVGKQDAK
ncbi:glycosyltransferase family 4 protein [Pedobacter sp. AW31-3R]|uniref:glycosyltransferase family 4 protein n=1 Tax=Pedobacter sp. AW31-3R TaxID=3445781 RepID=UPI003F9F3CA5